MSCLFAVMVSCDVFRCASIIPECLMDGKLCDPEGLESFVLQGYEY